MTRGNLRVSPGLLSQIANFGQGLTTQQGVASSSMLPPAQQFGPSGLGGMFARNLGGLLGKDMRTPEEKILAATAGIDRTTPAGQLEAIEARLQFETDPDKRNTLGQQAVQLRRQMASDARTAASDARQEKLDLEKTQGRANLVTALTEAGATDVATLVDNGAYTTAVGSQHLSMLKRAEKLDGTNLDQQRELVRLAGYEDNEVFSNFMTGKDTKPLSAAGLTLLLNQAKVDSTKQDTLETLGAMEQTPKVQAVTEMVEAGFLTGGQIGPALMSGDTVKNITSQKFRDRDGNIVGTAYVNGKPHSISYSTGEFIPVTAENPVTPIGDGKAKTISSAARRSFENVVDESNNFIDSDQREKYIKLDPQSKVNFNTSVIELAERRARSNDTTVEAEMLGAFNDLMNADEFNFDDPFYWVNESTFKVPVDLSKFVTTSASPAPPEPAATNGEPVVPWGTTPNKG